ncbi:acyltransferase domain-containing protein [Nostocaceae cyanobacterium CENA369]|uniref:Phenolphthiocerol/phthiocerol polyketide synthase subunit E n=1 Tax=Dendronalium phyllosphericum CENA369 TaxID=1725256 RepID=A0A8J7LD93_9NOST|nr:type I polyketide synthase [Dendronalium phyllosphericum]MBH8571753.1 acyltransferase domain-containing protein [Dendronalium phyllosphericum CENA369]
MSDLQMDNSIKGIAVISIVGRFPKAKNVDEFWENLCKGQESISFFSDEELKASGVDPAWLSNPQYVKAGANISDIEMFDAAFFDFSPREAEVIDPQHRILLECAWSALEKAGYEPGSSKSLTGVYLGTNMSNYFMSNLSSHPDLSELTDLIAYGNSQDFAATRVSYKLNLKGPSINIQTSCSTSLVAVHSACQGLLNYECDLALAGGVSIESLQKQGYFYQEGDITSPDGHCRAFDAQAQGTVFGDGIGLVVLKRLEDALAEGDYIHAVIKGSAINNDGAAKVGYTAPSVSGQAEVIAEAQAIAGVAPETITYIEAHGTGTALGDPIEISALKKAFAARTKQKGYCALGSVKTNIGHLNTAAGVTGLIKTVLALKHQLIPPSLHFQQPNPEIDFTNSPFYVNSKLSPWQTNGTPRRAGVSSFGIGGTNAHVILEQAPAIEPSSPSRTWQLLLLSAKTSTALETATINLATHLKQNPDINLADVAHTLQVGRRAFDHRRLVVCHELEDAVKALTEIESQRILTNHRQPSHCPVIFMFSGQGAQYANMARELYEHEPTFTKHVDNCAVALQPHLGVDIRSLLYPSAEDTLAASVQLQQTAFTQSALFVIEYALAQLFMSWGIQPQAMIGHSIGEYVAATIAGVFSLEDALMIVAKRGQLMQQLPSGSMLAIPLPANEVELLLKENLEIAVINSPSSCVVSGTKQAVAALENQLISQGIECRLLHTSHAFHSQMMQPILEEFVEIVKQVKLHPPSIGFISNVTGRWIEAAQATNPDYWGQHLRQTVRFSEGISQLIRQFEGVFLEVGPGRTLSTLTKQHLSSNAKQQVLSSLRHVKDEQSDVQFLLQTLGRLWLCGVEIDWSGFYAYEQRHRLPLPTYPFERQRFWIDAKSLSPSLNTKSASLDKKQDIADWFYVPSWKRSLLPNSFSSQIESTQEEWLFFIDELGIGEKLINVLKQKQNIITVKCAEQFSKVTDGVYTINQYRCEDYDTLFHELISIGRGLQNIAYLWSVNKVEINQSKKYLEFNSLLFLTQSISKLKISDRLQFWVISNNIQQVNGNEKLDPQKAAILGLCKVIPQEYPNITCRCIDVDLTNRREKLRAGVPPVEQTSVDAEKREGDYDSIIVDQLSNELTVVSLDLVVAYRDRYRWVQTFEPIYLESIVEEKTPLRKQGVYLFPGGLEDIEVAIAQYLAKTFPAKLIFIEDANFPENDDFWQWLETHNQQNETSRKIEQLLELEKLGAKVLVIRVDTNNDEKIYQGFSLENIGQINGVIYSTGIKREHLFCSISEIKSIESENVLNFQHHQIILLEQVLQKQKLDFCIVFSSLSSILGGFGLGLYSAANCFLDTFTNRHNQNNSLPWYIINWDKLEIEVNQNQQTTESKLAINSREAVEVFKRIFALEQGSQIVISTVDINNRNHHIFNPDFLANSKSLNCSDSSSRYSRPQLSNAYVTPTNELEQQITEIWQEVLGVTGVGIFDNFYELGGDSLIATQLVSRLRTKFPVDLPLRDLLLQAMIPAKQAEMIEELMLAKIEELSEEEVAVILNNS